MIKDNHACIPPAGRKRWWTCPDCGQLWRHDGTPPLWRLSRREAQL